MTNPQEHNRRAWDGRARRGERFTEPAQPEDLVDPLATVGGCGWLVDGVRGKRLLCLAAGGGRHGIIYAAAGAAVTVVDLSAEMLALDRQVAAERGFDVRTVQTSMDDLSMLPLAGFEIVIQPVSTCYVPDVRPVYREVARVLVGGGLYISQHKQPASMQAEIHPSPRGYELVEPYYREGPLPAVTASLHREEGTLEYLHRWEELLGEMCRAGFVIEDVIEPCHARRGAGAGDFGHRSQYVAPYVRIRARRIGACGDKGSGVFFSEAYSTS
jgi:SAM-dependent methyltransferase